MFRDFLQIHNLTSRLHFRPAQGSDGRDGGRGSRYFIYDSSHVAKVASDVTFLLLRVLPGLKPRGLIHFHDIYYPFSSPVEWIREGLAWNESIVLRAFLLGNRDFKIIAFNSFVGQALPELFRDSCPSFLDNAGGSPWLRKIGESEVAAN